MDQCNDTFFRYKWWERNSSTNYEYKIGEMDGKDMRSIFERWKDKRTQEKRYGGK